MRYLLTGNVTEVSLAMGIPRTTVQSWKSQEWWNDLIVAVRQEHNDELDARMTRIMDKTFAELEDRIEHGEATGKLGADGKPIKLPVRVRDLSITGAILFDKRQLLRSLPTAIKDGAGLSAIATELVQAFQLVVQRGEKTVEGTAERVTGGDKPAPQLRRR